MKSSAWRDNQITIEITKKGSDGILYAVPSLLRFITSQTNQGKAADVFLMQLNKERRERLNKTVFPTLQSALRQETSSITGSPESKYSASSLVKKLLKMKTELQGRNLLNAVTTGEASVRPPKTPKKKNRLRRMMRSRSGSAGSTSTAMSSGKEPLTARQTIDLHLRETLSTFKIEVVRDVLAFALSPMSRNDSLIPEHSIKDLIDRLLKGSGESFRMTRNCIMRMFINMKTELMTNIVVLYEFFLFIKQQSLFVSPTTVRIVRKILFDGLWKKGGEDVKKKNDMKEGKLLHVLEILIRGIELHFTGDKKKTYKMLNSNTSESTNVSDLNSFYHSLGETRFQEISERLIDLYDIKDIGIGIAKKYNVWVDQWKHLLRSDIAEVDLPGADFYLSPSEKPLKQRATIRARKSSDHLMLEDATELKRIETQIIVDEIDFNERMRILMDQFVREIRDVNKTTSKMENNIRYVCFDEPFEKMLETSTKIAVELEVLNLVRVGFKHTRKESNAEEPSGFSDSETKERIQVLCEIYESCSEDFYVGFAPFISLKTIMNDLLEASSIKLGQNQEKLSGGSSRERTRTGTASVRKSRHLAPAKISRYNKVGNLGNRNIGEFSEDAMPPPKKSHPKRSKESKEKTGTGAQRSIKKSMTGHSRNYFQLFKYISHQRRDLFKKESLIEVLNQPFERAERLQKNFKNLSDILTSSGAEGRLKDAALKLHERFQQIGLAFEKEIEAVDRVVSKLGFEKFDRAELKKIDQCLPRNSFFS